MKDFVDATAFNSEQGNRARKLFAAVVLAALDDAIADDKKYGNGPEQIARWARSRDGREVLSCAGIDPNERVVSGLMEFVGKGVRTSVALSREESERRAVQIDAATRRNLELTEALSGGRTGSLLSVIDRSVTAGGARLLAQRLASPSRELEAINKRLDAVQFVLQDGGSHRLLRVQAGATWSSSLYPVCCCWPAFWSATATPGLWHLAISALKGWLAG